MTEPEAAYRSGLAALGAGRPAAAVGPLREAAAAPGPLADWAGLNLGLALQELGAFAAAEPLLRAATAALPQLAEPHCRLGAIAGLRGDSAAAAGHFAAAIARAPDHVPALAALATLAAGQGRHSKAADLLAAARRTAPDDPELDLTGAHLARAAGRLDAAIAHAEAVLRARPAHPGAARLLAELLHEALGPAAALARIGAAAAADPFGPGWPLTAAALAEAAGDPARRVAELRTAHALAPVQPAILGELGKALADTGGGAEAEAALRVASAALPTDLDLRNRLATVLWRARRPAAMLAVLDAAVAEFGRHPTLELNRALALNAMGDQHAALEAANSAVASAPGGREALVNRIAVQCYHPEQGGAAALLAAARAIGAVVGPAAVRPGRARGRGGRLRVGLLSGGLGIHPVGWLTLAGIEALPEAEFEIAAYSLRPRTDTLAARFRARAAIWREMGDRTDAAIADAIAADGVDLLLELGGYGDTGRPFVLQHRPAPVQMKWVGAQFSTLGLDGVDWMLTDRWETPPGAERHYTERLLRLPDGYVCYTPPSQAPAVTTLPAEAAGSVTFGCFNNLAKLTPVVLAAWARILAALPAARLVLRTHMLGEAATRDAFARRCAAAGLPADRVTLAPGCPHAELLAAYGGIDIALDPFPYAGGLTVCEALWMGVPVVALAGDSFAGRHAVSHLSNVGLVDWIAADVDAYVALAVARARDMDALAALRAGLRARMAASPLCDAPRFGRALGDALRSAWLDAAHRPPLTGRHAAVT